MLKRENIIFLDIDEVIATAKAGEADRIDKYSVNLLVDIIKEFDIKLVITSVWRFEKNVNAFKRRLKESGGCALLPYIHPKWRTISTDKAFRGDEVDHWLNEYKKENPDTKIVYLCIDDGFDYHPHQPLVQPEQVDGFGIKEWEYCKLFFKLHDKKVDIDQCARYLRACMDIYEQDNKVNRIMFKRLHELKEKFNIPRHKYITDDDYEEKSKKYTDDHGVPIIG